MPAKESFLSREMLARIGVDCAIGENIVVSFQLFRELRLQQAARLLSCPFEQVSDLSFHSIQTTRIFLPSASRRSHSSRTLPSAESSWSGLSMPPEKCCEMEILTTR